MSNLYPGQGLGAKASKLLAHGLGPSKPYIGLTANIVLSSDLTNISLIVERNLSANIILASDFSNLTLLVYHSLSANINLVSNLNDINVGYLSSFTSNIQLVSNLSDIDLFVERLLTGDINLQSVFSNIELGFYYDDEIFETFIDPVYILRKLEYLPVKRTITKV